MNVFRVDYAKKGVYYVREFISIENVQRMRFWFIALMEDEHVLDLFCSKFKELDVDLRHMFEQEYNEYHGIEVPREENKDEPSDEELYPIATYDLEIRSSIPLEEVTHKSNNYFTPMYMSLDYNPLMVKDLPSYVIVLEDEPMFSDFDYIDDAGKVVHHGRFGKNCDQYEVTCVTDSNFMEVDDSTEIAKATNSQCEPEPSTSYALEMSCSDDDLDNNERPQHLRISKLREKIEICKRRRKRKGSVSMVNSNDVEIDSRSSSEISEKEFYSKNDTVEIYMRAQEMRKLKSKRVKRMYNDNEKARILEITEGKPERYVKIEVFSKKLFNQHQGWLKFRFKEIDGLMYCSQLRNSNEEFERALTYFRSQDNDNE